jgi:hypothetical protein
VRVDIPPAPAPKSVEHGGKGGLDASNAKNHARFHDDLGALAFRDIGDAGAHQRLLPACRRTSRTSQVSRPVETVNPLEDLQFRSRERGVGVVRAGCPSGCISALTASKSEDKVAHASS